MLVERKDVSLENDPCVYPGWPLLRFKVNLRFFWYKSIQLVRFFLKTFFWKQSIFAWEVTCIAVSNAGIGAAIHVTRQEFPNRRQLDASSRCSSEPVLATHKSGHVKKNALTFFFIKETYVNIINYGTIMNFLFLCELCFLMVCPLAKLPKSTGLKVAEVSSPGGSLAMRTVEFIKNLRDGEISYLRIHPQIWWFIVKLGTLESLRLVSLRCYFWTLAFLFFSKKKSENTRISDSLAFSDPQRRLIHQTV